MEMSQKRCHNVNVEEYEKEGEWSKTESIPRCAFGNIHGSPSCRDKVGEKIVMSRV